MSECEDMHGDACTRNDTPNADNWTATNAEEGQAVLQGRCKPFLDAKVEKPE
jgi:hypothetical protein